MNKELLISIKPEHLVNILNGKQTLEPRKTVPKDYKGWVNIYCTKSKPYFLYLTKKDVDYSPEFNYLITPQHKKNKKWNNNYLNGKVVARFWFDEYEEIKERWNCDEWVIMKLDELCLTDDEVREYLINKRGYAWHIKQLEIFDKPKELSEFGVERPPQSYQFVYVKE